MSIVAQLKEIVGSSHVVTSDADLSAWGTDWTRVFPVKPVAAVLPSSTDEVSRIVKACRAAGVAIVPSGGRTGLAAGAVASNGEVVLSLSRMNRIEQIDKVGMTIQCEAGVTTQQIQDVARDAGMFFGLDLAAKGSCQIGGNISTNAGGLKFIRYGGMREQVLGLEVVLPSGEVLDMMSSLRKNNTGYDLKQLFVGAEGTLGIVTRAVLRLMPRQRNLQIACMGVESFSAIPRILTLANLEGVQITAFEFFTDVAHEIVLKHSPGARTPFASRWPFYVLLEVEEGPAGSSVIEPLLEKIFEAGLIGDAVVGSTSAQFKELWGLRENITESISAHGQVRKNDIALPIDKLEPFIAELEEEMKGAPQEIKLVLFGHIGDGNLHINYVGSRDIPKEKFQATARSVEERIFKRLPKYKGSVSAEHGIGMLKKKDLAFSRSAPEIEMMKKFKLMLDPQNLMNPGKIFDV